MNKFDIEQFKIRKDENEDENLSMTVFIQEDNRLANKETSKTVAKIVKKGKKEAFFIKSASGRFLNPRMDPRQKRLASWKMLRVQEKILKYYRKFLETNSEKYLTLAEREVV